VDHINEISDWYDTKLSPSDRLKLNHPETIVKHVPKELLSIDPKDNTKVHKVAKKKKPAVSAETERLRAILIRVIKILAKYEPETARELMDEIMPKGTSDGPSDNIDDLFRPQDEEE
jgi:DNA-directed RNA polymerase subunit F